MTPDRWEAMQTAANRQDAHDWIVVVGWAAVITAAIFLTIVALADALVMAVDSPLLDGLDASKRLDLADSDPWGGLTPDEAADLRMVASDLEPLRLIRDGLSSGEMAALTMAASLGEVRLLLPRVDARLRHLVLDAMAAIAEESAGVVS